MKSNPPRRTRGDFSQETLHYLRFPLLSFDLDNFCRLKRRFPQGGRYLPKVVDIFRKALFGTLNHQFRLCHPDVGNKISPHTEESMSQTYQSFPKSPQSLFIKSDQPDDTPEGADLVVTRRLCIVWLATCPDTLSCNQSEAPALFRKRLRNPHHISPHDDRQFIVRTFQCINRKLDICKVHHMKPDRPGIRSHLFARSTTFCLARSLVYGGA